MSNTGWVVLLSLQAAIAMGRLSQREISSDCGNAGRRYADIRFLNLSSGPRAFDSPRALFHVSRPKCRAITVLAATHVT
jgi:hypothetical protein